MEFRQLVPPDCSFPHSRRPPLWRGTEFFKAWGSTDVAGATRLVDICLDAGANLFDTANVLFTRLSEEILGKAIAGKRHRVLVSTKPHSEWRTAATASALLAII